MFKKPERSLFYVFQHFETVQNSHFSFLFKEKFEMCFESFLMSPKGRCFIFLILCNKLDFQKAQRVLPFTILNTLRFLALDIAPTLDVPVLLA